MIFRISNTRLLPDTSEPIMHKDGPYSEFRKRNSPTKDAGCAGHIQPEVLGDAAKQAQLFPDIFMLSKHACIRFNIPPQAATKASSAGAMLHS
jgi:hypothetical protein